MENLGYLPIPEFAVLHPVIYFNSFVQTFRLLVILPFTFYIFKLCTRLHSFSSSFVSSCKSITSSDTIHTLEPLVGIKIYEKKKRASEGKFVSHSESFPYPFAYFLEMFLTC